MEVSLKWLVTEHNEHTRNAINIFCTLLYSMRFLYPVFHFKKSKWIGAVKFLDVVMTIWEGFLFMEIMPTLGKLNLH